MRKATVAPPPSRYSNPFATCWTRPGALEFQFAPGETVGQLLAQLEAAHWRGEIVGPHGSGKSTLIETLRPHLVASGWNVATITLAAGERRLPSGFVRRSLATARPLLIIDGFEQLSAWNRYGLRYRCRRASAGLLATSHAAVYLPLVGLPLVYRTQPSHELAARLVSMLTAKNPSPISAADVAASHARCGSNLRELLFALYERHEALAARASAPSRTPANASA